jgi:hypothetical protein
LIVALISALSFAASPWADLPGDVQSTHSVAADPAAVLSEISDLQRLFAAYPEGCVARVEPSVRTGGVGGRVVATWTPSVMNRRLTFDIKKVEPGYIQIEALTDRGFTVRYTVTAEGDGARLDAHAYISPPPWPFRRIWHEDVAPAWRACDAGLAASLAAKLPKPAPAEVAPSAPPAAPSAPAAPVAAPAPVAPPTPVAPSEPVVAPVAPAESVAPSAPVAAPEAPPAAVSPSEPTSAPAAQEGSPTP